MVLRRPGDGDSLVLTMGPHRAHITRKAARTETGGHWAVGEARQDPGLITLITRTMRQRRSTCSTGVTSIPTLIILPLPVRWNPRRSLRIERYGKWAEPSGPEDTLRTCRATRDRGPGWRDKAATASAVAALSDRPGRIRPLLRTSSGRPS